MTRPTPAETSQDLRWQDCDELDDRLSRIECRTSHTNDAIHQLIGIVNELRHEFQANIGRLDERDDQSVADRADIREVVGRIEERQTGVIEKLGGLRVTKWAAIAGVATTVIKLGVDLGTQFIHP